MKNYQLSPQHYLDIAEKANHPYYAGFVKAFERLFDKLSSNQQKVLEQKLQLVGRSQFDEAGFVQIACETTICAYFAKLYPQKFRYEYKSTSVSKKDVDCQFTNGKYTYNIEVKCPGLKTYEEKADEMPKIEMKGRFDESGRTLIDFIERALQDQLNKDQAGWNYSVKKRLDNTFMTFLQDAHNKFPTIELTDQANILVVCCDDANDMTRWHDYLYQTEGCISNCRLMWLA